MNIKMILGVLIPLSVAVVLVLLSISGKSAEIQFEFSEKVSLKQGKIGTINIRNDHFMQRKIPIPKYHACAISFNDSRSNNELFLEYYYDGKTFRPYRDESVNLMPNENAEIDVIIRTHFKYESKEDFDQIIISDKSFNSCTFIPDDIYSSAQKISLS